MLEKIEYQGNKLLINSNFLMDLLTLFSYRREIVVDPDLKTVSAMTKYLYFIESRREIKFSDLWYIDYEYQEVQTKHSSSDYYTASLVTRNERKIKLFTMKGQDSSHLGRGINIVDGSYDESRWMVVEFSTVIGIPIGKPLPEGLEMVPCEKCGRKLSAVSVKCLFCGATRTRAK